MSTSKKAAKPKLSINLEEVKQARTVLRALNHKMRQKILHLIDANKEMMVSDVYAKLKLEQSLTSAYLGILRKAGVVKTRRDGQAIYYSVDHKHIAEITRGAKTINSK